MQGDRNRVLPIGRALLDHSKHCSPTHAGCIITFIAQPNRTFRGKKLYPKLPINEEQLKDSQASIWASYLKRHIEGILIIKVAASYSSPFLIETWPNFVGAAFRYCDLAMRK